VTYDSAGITVAVTEADDNNPVDLTRIMLRLWDRLRQLASQDQPADDEINTAIENFSTAWQSAIASETGDPSARPRPNVLPETFARLLYKRLRLQYLEYTAKPDY